MKAIEYFDAGFTRQVSVLPPNAQVSPNSKLSADDAGKAPGIRGWGGQYHGYDWRNHQPTREEVAHWVHGGANIGFLSSAYPAIDIDIMHEEVANAAVEAVEAIMGPCLIRTGRYPKRLLVFRSEGPLRTFMMHYARWDDLLGAEERLLIEFLGEGRQYVMDGIHPVTGEPYHIEDPLFALDLGPESLPLLTPDKVVEVFDAIEEAVANKGFDATTKAESKMLAQEVEQDTLKAPDIETLVELVGRAPNSVPDRDKFITVGYAIKAASQDDPELGFDIFMDWCSRWSQGTNDPSYVEAQWAKMVPPYHVGYYWLIDTIKTWNVSVSDLEFGLGDTPPTEDEPFSSSEVKESKELLQAKSEYAQYSDGWLIQDFVSKYKDSLLMSRSEISHFFSWNGSRWERRPLDHINTLVGGYLRSLVGTVAMAHENPKDGEAAAMRMSSAHLHSIVKRGVLDSPVLNVDVSQLDADPDIINTQAGPVHMPTGRRVKPDPGLFLTKVAGASFDPTATCPRWEKFILESSQGDPENARMIKALSGYMLTGHTREQILPFFVGKGENGKSVYTAIMDEVAGEYSDSIPSELLQTSRGGGEGSNAYQLAKLPGLRMAFTSETRAGSTWDDQKLKQLTGEDTIDARKPYGMPFSFESNASILVIGNHYPDLTVVSDAIARRIKVIPWENKPVVRDNLLKDKLRAELPGILNWVLEGAQDWYENGITFSQASAEETREYLTEQDIMGAWFSAQVGEGDWNSTPVTSKALYENFRTWVRVNTGSSALPYSVFSQSLPQLARSVGGVRTRVDGVRGWKRMKLKEAADVPSNVVNFPAGIDPSKTGKV